MTIMGAKECFPGRRKKKPKKKQKKKKKKKTGTEKESNHKQVEMDLELKKHNPDKVCRNEPEQSEETVLLQLNIL